VKHPANPYHQRTLLQVSLKHFLSANFCSDFENILSNFIAQAGNYFIKFSEKYKFYETLIFASWN
jgi:hypothetical protein